MNMLENNLRSFMPEKCYGLNTHVWSKSDKDLDSLAKKHKLKNGAEIWKAKENSALVKKRKKPENLQPGDKIAIPIPAKVEQHRIKVVREYNETKKAYVAYVKTLNKDIELIEKNIEKLYKQVDALNRKKFDAGESKKELIDLLSQIESLVKPMEKVVGTVVPLDKISFGKLPAVSNYLKKERAEIKAGRVTDASLERLRKVIDQSRKDILGIRKQIKGINDKLAKKGIETLKELCKLPALEFYAQVAIKEFKK